MMGASGDNIMNDSSDELQRTYQDPVVAMIGNRTSAEAIVKG